MQCRSRDASRKQGCLGFALDQTCVRGRDGGGGDHDCEGEGDGEKGGGG